MAKQTKAQNAQHTEKETAKVKILVGTRGRVFEGTIVKKFPTRVVIEAERTVYVQKYERFYKKKMRIHSRIPMGMELAVGDYVKVRECRPLSKIIHSVVIEKVRSAEQNVAAKKLGQKTEIPQNMPKEKSESKESKEAKK